MSSKGVTRNYDLSLDDLRELSLSARNPISTLRLSDGANLSVFLGKMPGSEEWEQEELRLLAQQARRTYGRYGKQFEGFDAYDTKAAHYLTKIEYAVDTDAGVVDVSEWHSLRYISPEGEPFGTEDLHFYVVGEDGHTLHDVMSSSDPASGITLERLKTLSRICRIQPIAIDAAQQSQLDKANIGSRYTALAFATNIRAFIDHFAESGSDLSTWWVTVQMWDSLLRNIVGIPEINYALPFQPASRVLAAEDEVAVYMDRRDNYAYKVPTFFLNWPSLIKTLNIIEASHPGSIPQKYLELPSELSLRCLDTDEQLRETTIQLGQFLTRKGRLGETNLTGEMVRAILDQHVPDQPALYLAQMSDLRAGCEYVISHFCNRSDMPPALDVQYLKYPETINQQDRTQFPYRPVLMEAEVALKYGQVVINADRSVTLHNPDIADEPFTVPPHQIFSTIYQTYENLNRVVSTAVRHYGDQILPPDNELGAETFGKFVHEEYTKFMERMLQSEADGQLLFGYGNFLFDPLDRRLYHIAPQQIHELALLTSQTLYEDPQGRDLYDIWRTLKSKMIVICGNSVGSNIADALVKATIGARLRLVDMDFTEPGNIFRIARSNLAALTHPLSVNESGSLFEQNYRNKAATLARELLLVNPYLQLELYLDGLSERNVESVFGEADLIFDEIDNVDFKISLLRMKARDMGIPVMMITDLDGRVAFEYHPYHLEGTPLLNGISDQMTEQLLIDYRRGGKDEFIALLEAMVGGEYDLGPFGDFIHGRRKSYLTSSLPQHGETAMGAGYLGSKMAVAYLLGHDIPTRYYLVPPYGTHYRGLEDSQRDHHDN